MSSPIFAAFCFMEVSSNGCIYSPAFQKKFYECKVVRLSAFSRCDRYPISRTKIQINKKRLADYVFAVQKRHMNPEAVVDIQVKRIHEVDELGFLICV